MSKRTFLILASLTAVTVASCSKPATSPATVAGNPAVGTTPVAAEPRCSVESSRVFKLGDESELRSWDIKAAGLKRLTVRLLFAANGKVETTNQIEYKWDEWEPTAPAATGQLVLLIQDGSAFGVKEKRLALMALDLQGSPNHTMTGTKTPLLLEGDLISPISGATHTNPLNKRNILFYRVFVPKTAELGTVTIGSNPESIAAAAQEGRTIVAVSVDWDDK